MEYQPDLKRITGNGGMIASIEAGSIAEELGLQPGDVVYAVGDQVLRDVIDYRFAIADEQIELFVRRGDEEMIYEIEKDPDEDLGIFFVEPLFDRLRTCNNKCPFCFLTQMPKGLRRTLYLKDDDYRLGFLYGNFVTLTNLTEEDWERIEKQHLSPMYVSIHATDRELRSVLRSLFLTRATPVVLADLLERVSLPAGGGSATHPLAGRATTVLACPFDDTESLALADDMFRQQHPPAEVVVPDSRAAFAGIQRLKDRGIPVRTVATAPEDRWSAAEWAQLAAAATTPWTALWDQPAGEFFLADALCAAECSGADAVGPAVDPAASGADYVFVSAVRPVLARRELVRKGLPPQQWSRHGARLLALSAAGPAASSPVPEHTPGG